MLALVSDIRERGIDQPIIVDPESQIMDGRHRHRAAKIITLDVVPCIVRDSSEAGEIIRAAIFQRRHYSKSALAWLALPYVIAATFNGRAKWAAKAASPWKSELPSDLAQAKTQEQLADELGLSRETLRQAMAVGELFAARPEVREEFLPRLMAGEASFWNILSAVAGRDATKGKARPGLAESQLELFDSTWSHLKRGASAWKRFNDSQKEVVMQQFRATAAHLPMELRHALAEVLTSFDAPAK
jgi:ParB-like chromosome segregation protein Spo0J